MSDHFTEVEREGFFGGIGNSFGSALFGLVLFLASFGVHWWNEGRAVDRYEALEQGAKDVVVTQGYDAANANKLVHVTGETEVKSAALDKAFNVQTNDSMKLIRNVEMYQWKETKRTRTEENLGGEKVKRTTYSYDKKWSNHAINSSNFKKRNGHENPKMEHKSKTFYGDDILLKDYEISNRDIDKLDNLSQLPLPKNASVPKNIGESSSKSGNYLFVSKSGASSMGNPSVGDYRISFKHTPKGTISVVAQQSGYGFSPYMTKTGELYEVRSGNMSADAIFKKAASENSTFTWILRGVGLLVMTIGLAMVASPIRAVLDFIPFLGNMFGAVSGFFALIVSLLLSSITIAVSWFAHRPMLSIMIAGAGIGVWFLARMMQPKKQGA